MANRHAGEGEVWVCGACGKRSPDLYGLSPGAHGGWDESCMLNAFLCRESHLVLDEHGRVREVRDGGVVEGG